MKNTFSILLKAFYPNKIIYIIDTPKDRILDKLDDLFTEKKELFKPPNLRGGFVHFPNGFWIEPTWSFIATPGG